MVRKTDWWCKEYELHRTNRNRRAVLCFHQTFLRTQTPGTTRQPHNAWKSAWQLSCSRARILPRRVSPVLFLCHDVFSLDHSLPQGKVCSCSNMQCSCCEKCILGPQQCRSNSVTSSLRRSKVTRGGVHRRSETKLGAQRSDLPAWLSGCLSGCRGKGKDDQHFTSPTLHWYTLIQLY